MSIYGYNDIIPEEDREKKGLYEKAIKMVSCPCCKKDLVKIVVVDDKEVNLTHIVVCPDCDEESFKTKTSGSYVYMYPEDKNGRPLYKPLDIEYIKQDEVKLTLRSTK